MEKVSYLVCKATDDRVIVAFKIIDNRVLYCTRDMLTKYPLLLSTHEQVVDYIKIQHSATQGTREEFDSLYIEAVGGFNELSKL